MIVIEKYGTMAEANHKLAGGIIGGVKSDGLFHGLVGKTITFTEPSGSHEFTQPADAPGGALRFKDVQEQLEDAIANLNVVSVDNKVGFRHATPDTAVALSSADEPARILFGFPNEAAIAGRVLEGPDGTAPKLVSAEYEYGSVILVVEV